MDATPTDAELLARSDLDASAFTVLYRRHNRAVLAYFRRRTTEDAAFELLTETFAQAWLSRHRFADRRNGNAGPWLSGIARHVWFRSLRTARIEQRARQRLSMLAAESVATELPSTDGDGITLDLLDRLGPAQRQAVRLRVVDGHPYEEVARRLDCSPVAARIRVSRGLDQLRRHLQGVHP